MSRVSNPDKSIRRWLRLHQNNRGSVLLLVMIAAPVAAALFFSLIEMTLVAKRQALINRNMVSYSAVMDSVIDYTNYAIKNRWCMTTNWTRDTNCTISHAMSLERLTLDTSAISALRDLNTDNGAFAASVVAERIGTTFNVDDVVGTHPLIDVVKNLEKTGKAVSQISIEVKRINDTNVPRRGRESFLDVKVTLMSGGIIFRNLSAVTATSRIMVTPRELNYFSLIVPRDLYLDGTLPGAQGDIGIPAGTGGVGVSFESPVFVNGDIHIPRSTANYTSATFTNRLIIGGSNGTTGGRVMQNGSPFTAPNDGSMASYLYSALPKFGGFKKGVDIDGVRDSGLDVLAGYAATATPTSAASECIGVNNINFKLKNTNTSDIVFKPIAQNGNEFRFYVGLTQGNMFLEQEVRPSFVGPNGSGGKAFLTNMLNSEQAGYLDGYSWMLFRFDAGPNNGTALGGTPTAGNNNYTTVFTLRPNTKATMRFPENGTGPAAGRVEVEMRPVYFNGDTSRPMQKSVVELVVRTTQAQHPGTIRNFSVYMKAYDLGVFSGRDRRYPGNNVDVDSYINGHALDGWLHFRMVGGSASSPGTLQWIDPAGVEKIPGTAYNRLDLPLPVPPVGYTPPAPPTAPLVFAPKDIPFASLPNELVDYQALVHRCTKDSAGRNGMAFKTIGWNSPFVNTTRHSWHFAPHPAGGEPDTSYQSIPVSAPNQALVVGNGTFYVHSIVNQCIIPATTTVASGFLTCDQLVIQARSTPLTIIGTIIAGRASIDASAVRSGVTFRSIYHPQSTADLIAQGVLKNKNNTPCTNPPAVPVWWPTLSNTQYDSLRKCNVISLRDKANPFSWTAVNPDCGIAGGGAKVQCQKHALNYILNEISRTSELQ